MEVVQNQDNVIDEIANGLIFWTSEYLSDRTPVNRKYFGKLVNQVREEHPFS